MEIDSVMTKALALPESSRAKIAARLLASLAGSNTSLNDDNLVIEAQRRSDEMADDPSCVMNHEEFMAEFRNRVK